MTKQQGESWHEFGEKRLCAMVNGEGGWLMWLADSEGDAGFSSRGDLEAQGESRFQLANGQQDSHPKAWMLTKDTLQRAVDHFKKTGERAPFVTWHDDGA